MIARVWRGWTAHQNADALEAVLRTQSIPGFLAKNIAGLREAQVLRLERLGETEFMMMLWFDDMDAVRAMAVARGIAEEDYDKSTVSLAAHELLRRFDLKVTHYEVKDIMRLDPARAELNSHAVQRPETRIAIGAGNGRSQ
jgi:hypothetical protein